MFKLSLSLSLSHSSFMFIFLHPSNNNTHLHSHTHSKEEKQNKKKERMEIWCNFKSVPFLPSLQNDLFIYIWKMDKNGFHFLYFNLKEILELNILEFVNVLNFSNIVSIQNFPSRMTFSQDYMHQICVQECDLGLSINAPFMDDLKWEGVNHCVSKLGS